MIYPLPFPINMSFLRPSSAMVFGDIVEKAYLLVTRTCSFYLTLYHTILIFNGAETEDF